MKTSLLLAALLAAPLNAETLAEGNTVFSPTRAATIHKVHSEFKNNKVLSFKFNTGSLFRENNAHLWAIAQGWMEPSDKVPMRGWGITAGYTHVCDGLGFEHFKPPKNSFPEGCIEVDWEDNRTYHIKVVIQGDEMKARIDDSPWISTTIEPYPYNDTVIGVAGDKNPSHYSLMKVQETVW